MMTIIKSIEEITIYESPDGGKTVYARKSGDTDRTLIREDPDKRVHDRWFKWRDILHMSEDNVTLKDLVEKAEMVYEIVKKENK
jgi:hypothetical protein